MLQLFWATRCRATSRHGVADTLEDAKRLWSVSLEADIEEDATTASSAIKIVRIGCS